VLVAALAVAGMCRADDETAGGTAGESLLLMSSARSEGLLAPVAGGGGLNGLVSNPASLAGQLRPAVSGSYTDLLAGSSLGQVEAAVPVAGAVFAVQFGSFSAGETDVPSESGQLVKVSLQEDLVAGGSVALPVAPGLSAGLTAKWFQSTLAETYKASTQLFDAGLRYVMPGGELSLGASVRNMGGSLKYYESAMALPLESSAGASFCVWHTSEGQVLVLGEADKVDAADFQYSFGSEAVYKGVLVIRGGLRLDDGLMAASAGAGLRYRSYGFDFARVSRRDMPASFRVSAEMNF
jgi:hypothetical protein